MKTRIIRGDAKKIKLKKKANLVITSPPYISAQEYLRSTRLEFFWLGFNSLMDLGKLRSQTLGLEGFRSNVVDIPEIGINKIDQFVNVISKKSKNKGFLIAKYFLDFQQVLQKININLFNDGYLVLVIGNNTILGKKIPSNKFYSISCRRKWFYNEF